MNEEKINKSPKKQRILVAPLDWGLGHATRCIPIIHTLLKHNTEVLLAASGPIRSLLEKEFPTLKILPLPGYNITYSKHPKLFVLNLITQLPKILFAIRKERRWLRKLIAQENIDAVISDNRPGLHNHNIPCVYITHQLQIQTGGALTDTYIRKLHYHYINKFHQCWIPDQQASGGLGGALSHPVFYPEIPCRYLGILSRFEQKLTQKKHKYLLLLSGPEPQRSILEKKLLQVFDAGTQAFVLVRGLPAGAKTIPLQNAEACVYNHLSAADLNDLILQSEIVVARAGYSTIMDLARLQRKAILIPTPGQTEQEYLGNYLAGNKMFAVIKQEEISFEKIAEALAFSASPVKKINTSIQEDVITDWLTVISQPASAM